VRETVLVEPSTGVVYSPGKAPYLSLEAMWNDKNFWACMQTGDGGIARLSFDTLDPSLWEYAFLDGIEGGLSLQVREAASTNFASAAGAGVLANGGATAAAAMAESERVLDLPPSWVSQLVVSREMVALRYPPHGSRTIFFRRAKLELFAEGVHPQGLTARITRYKDGARTITLEVREAFAFRRDKLQRRILKPIGGYVREDFGPGRPLGLRRTTERLGRAREWRFYVAARLDGLASREEVYDGRSKIIERYENRPDRLLAVAAAATAAGAGAVAEPPPTYVLPGGDDERDLVIVKMTEKFSRNRDAPAAIDVSKRTYGVATGSVRSVSHHADGAVTRNTRTHWKDNHRGGAGGGIGGGGGGGSGGAGGGSSGGGGNDGYEGLASGDGGVGGLGGLGSSSSSAGGGETLSEVLQAEKACFTSARHTHMEMLELRRVRRREEAAVALQRPIFHTARERRAARDAEGETASTADAADAEKERQLDYLTPYLPSAYVAVVAAAAAGGVLRRDEAQRARDACLKALRDRLVERANIINGRLNEESVALARKQAAFQRNNRGADAAAEEAFEHACSEAMFRIQILEQRLVQHEETALKKYAELDARLAADPRLRSLLAG
ncbi:unnamed protein product, partial [Phaeothamnion confervicola]